MTAAEELKHTEAAFKRVRDKLIAELLATKVGESLLRDKLVLTIQALEAVQNELMQAVNTDLIQAHAEQVQQALGG